MTDPSQAQDATRFSGLLFANEKLFTEVKNPEITPEKFAFLYAQAIKSEKYYGEHIRWRKVHKMILKRWNIFILIYIIFKGNWIFYQNTKR